MSASASTDKGARYNEGGNLQAARLPEIDWTTDHRAMVMILFRWTEGAAISTLNWYLSEKKSKARWSRALRASSVFFIAAGTLAPIISVGTDNVRYAYWGYPALGLGAAFFGIDRAFGFSSSWMRYLSAAAGIQKILITYQIKWADLTASWNADPGVDQVHLAVQEIVMFAEKLSDLVADETETWITQFRGNVTLLEAEVGRA
jgi:hypothetical protein